MSVKAIGSYQPAWADSDGRRVRGPDEDVMTMAVAAGREAIEAARDPVIGHVTLVTRQPDVLDGFASEVLAIGLGLAVEVAVELKLGGACTTLESLATGDRDGLVIAVEPGPPAVSAAAVLGPGCQLRFAGRVNHSLPIEIERRGEFEPRHYADLRLLRERGWRLAIERLGDARSDLLVAGIPAREARRFGVSEAAEPVSLGAASPILSLSALAADGRSGRLVAVDGGDGVAADVASTAEIVARSAAREPALPVAAMPTMQSMAKIPFSMPAYDRALSAKVGLQAQRCTCGALSFPPRSFCPSCGSTDEGIPEQLPRRGFVYTAVTVHVPIPGIAGPYGLAIIELEGVQVRVLAHVTDVSPASIGIGAEGELVLRRVATREGVDDYGYGWRPASAGDGGDR